MGQIATLFAKIGADTSELDRALKRSRSGLKSMSNTATRAGKLAAAGLAVGSVALVKLGADSLSMAAEFEEGIAILSTAVDSADADMAQLSKAALKMGADTELVGISASDAVDAMTILAKAGLSTAEIFGGENGLNDFLADNASLSGAARAAADLQAASELGLAESAEAVAIAMKTFNLEAKDATTIADSFVQSADASVASVSGLVQALENVGPTAASFGFSLQDTNTALAILSGAGIRGAEAGTALKSMMTNLLRDTPKVTGVLEDLGVKLFDNEGTMKSLPRIIDILTDSMEGLTQEQRLGAIQTLAGTFGMKAMATLLKDGRRGWDDMATSIEEAASAQEIARVRTETYKGKMEALNGVIESLKIRIGLQLIPIVTDLAVKFAEFIDKNADKFLKMFIKIGAEIKRIPKTLRPVIELVGKFVDLIKANKDKVIGAIKGIAAAFAVAAIADKVMGIVKVMGLLTSPIGLIIGAAALLGAAWEENWGGIREIVAAAWEQLGPILENIVAWLQVNIPRAIEFLIGVWEKMQPGVERIWNAVVGVIESAVGLIESVWNAFIVPLIEFIEENWEGIKAIFETAWNAISIIVETALGVIKGIFDFFSALFSGDWEGMWEAVKGIAESIWNGIVGLWNNFWSNIGTILETLKAGIEIAWSNFWDGISAIATDIWNIIVLAWDEFWGGIANTIEAFKTGIETAWDNFWSGMANAVTSILGPIVSFIQGIIDGIKEALGLAETLKFGGATAAGINRAEEVSRSDQAERAVAAAAAAGGVALQSGVRSMIVPPGFNNDSAFVRVRSGEEVSVKTPGNAGGSNAEMLFLVAQLTDAINSLPRQIRDGLKMGMA